MKFREIVESTTSGSVAPVSAPIGGTQVRGKGVYPNEKGGNLLKGKKTNAKFANSQGLSEDELAEQDLILVPGQGHRLKSGFVPHGKSRIDHEVEMARSDLYSAAKNARQVYELIKDRSEDEGLEGWVQEKIIKANDYLNTIREYLEGKKVQEAGVIAAGGVGEAVAKGENYFGHKVFSKEKVLELIHSGNWEANNDVEPGKFVELRNTRNGKTVMIRVREQGMTEGAKVDRMVKHIAKSERELGKSKDEAEDIAWATVNKRGYLDNKNKKKGK